MSPHKIQIFPGFADTKDSTFVQQNIWVITGPAGCGKSSVAQYLAQQLRIRFIEGDEYHPASNIDKMSRGIPLTDADRWDWLIVLRNECLAALSSGSGGVVLACSALKRKYRDVLRIAAYRKSIVCVHFLYVRVSERSLLQRVASRRNHFMKQEMVKSQLNGFEEPQPDETDCAVVCGEGPMGEVKMEALATIAHQDMCCA